MKRRLTLCKERVQYYINIGAVELVQEEPSIAQPLHVIDKAGRKPRMVLDLSRNLNDLIDKEAFTQQSFQDAVDLSFPGCYYGKMDLGDCFLSFDVHPDSHQYLAFQLDGEFYKFKRLLFGLTSSPFWC